VRTASGLSSELKIGLAKSCLNNKLDKEASEVMLAVMNDVNSGVSMQQAMGVFVKAGRQDLAEGIGHAAQGAGAGTADVAAEKTNMGDFKGAVQTCWKRCTCRREPAGDDRAGQRILRSWASWAGTMRWPRSAAPRSSNRAQARSGAHPLLGVLDKDRLCLPGPSFPPV
jgi:hypothetical protein